MSIRFKDKEVSYTQFLEDVSKAVVKRLRKEGKVEEDLLTTAEAAKVLGITPEHLRHVKDRYAPIKRGDGTKQGRLLFSRSNLLQ